MEIINKVKNYINKYNLLNENEKIIVGLSGGADSVALFLILNELNYLVYPIHLNHGIRQEASNDYLFCKKLCDKMNIHLELINKDIPNIAKDKKISEEEAGRIERYEAFNKYAKSCGANKIAVAHHRMDQAETIIHRFLRGSGTLGLIGMRPKYNNIVRPVLDCTKEELIEYLNQKGIGFCTDNTNFTTDYTRNKIRLELIPYIQKNFNANIVGNLNRFSEIISVEEEYMNLETEKAYNKAKMSNDCFDIEMLKKLHRSILRRVIRKIILNYKGNMNNIEFLHIEAVIKLLVMQSGKNIELPNNIVFTKEFQKLIIKSNDKIENSKDYEITIDINKHEGTILIENNIKIEYKIIEDINYKDLLKKSKNLYTKCFDYDTMYDNLTVRTRRAKDYIHINKKGSTKTLKKVFIDDKISKSIRNDIPLITIGNMILWIVGHRVNPKYLVNSETSRALVIETKIIEN